MHSLRLLQGLCKILRPDADLPKLLFAVSRSSGLICDPDSKAPSTEALSSGHETSSHTEDIEALQPIDSISALYSELLQQLNHFLISEVEFLCICSRQV